MPNTSPSSDSENELTKRPDTADCEIFRAKWVFRFPRFLRAHSRTSPGTWDPWVVSRALGRKTIGAASFSFFFSSLLGSLTAHALAEHRPCVACEVAADVTEAGWLVFLFFFSGAFFGSFETRCRGSQRNRCETFFCGSMGFQFRRHFLSDLFLLFPAVLALTNNDVAAFYPLCACARGHSGRVPSGLVRVRHGARCQGLPDPRMLFGV